MDRLISSLKEAGEILGIKFPPSLYKTEQEYPFLISEYYLNLIERKNPFSDPIFLQTFPSGKELVSYANLSEDPQDEGAFAPLPKLVHRYKDRALILTTNRCSSFCRFCFRKRYWKSGSTQEDITKTELDRIFSYIEQTSTIEEIILSGGDPLMLSNAKLKFILDSLKTIPNIKTIRLATRIPVTLPERITPILVKMLSKYENLWLVTHFNHTKELTTKSIEACKKITSSGIPMLNQTVLLKGVNDSPETLRELFRNLVSIKVKPYYLFHIDTAKGVTHFATGIEKGLEIMRYFRQNLSGIATPQFAIDLPEGGGKVSLQPSYSKDNKVFESVNGVKEIKYEK